MTSADDQHAKDLPWLIGIMRRLLAPDGCPWDREQTLESIKPFMIEEAYEVLEAIDEDNPEHHREELGDLLFQIVFQAELGGHTMEQVIASIGDKLIHRHPHVFGDTHLTTSGQVLANWERIKRQERGRPAGLLASVPRTIPALQRAQRLTGKAAKVGFDWPDLPSVRDKVSEEIGELDAAIASGDRQQMDHELGDLLFALVNWARKLDLSPEDALGRANQRFIQRFAHIEKTLEQQGTTPAESSLEQMDLLWNEAKRLEDQGE